MPVVTTPMNTRPRRYAHRLRAGSGTHTGGDSRCVGDGGWGGEGVIMIYLGGIMLLATVAAEFMSVYVPKKLLKPKTEIF